MSKYPVPSRLRNMASKFEELHASGSRLDFEEPRVTKCGTVACHGGWAGVALAADVGDSCRDFLRGAEALSNYVCPGWSWRAFEFWAARNPDIWGNEHGEDMFNLDGYRAFGFEEPGRCTLKDIADHIQ